MRELWETVSICPPFDEAALNQTLSVNNGGESDDLPADLSGGTGRARYKTKAPLVAPSGTRRLSYHFTTVARMKACALVLFSAAPTVPVAKLKSP